MSRSVKGLRELICISRLSIRSDSSSSDEDIFETERILSRPHTNQASSTSGCNQNRQKDREVTETNRNEIVVGRPKSAVGGMRRPDSAATAIRSTPRSNDDLNMDIYLPDEAQQTHDDDKIKVASSDTTTTKKASQSPSSNVLKFSSEVSLLTENRLEDILQYIDTSVINNWLERCNEQLNDIIGFLKHNSTFVTFANFMLTDFHYSKRKELTKMEASIILDELHFAFKVGIEDDKVTTHDMKDLLSIVMREYPSKLLGRKGTVYLLNTLCTFCHGKDKHFRQLFSDIKYSTRNKQITQWLLGMRAFSLVSLCSGIIDFYKNYASLQSKIDDSQENHQSCEEINTKLHWFSKAIKFGFFDVVHFLYEQQTGDCLPITDDQWKNMIQRTVVCGKEKILKYFLDKNMLNMAKKSDLCSALLQTAVNVGKIEIAKILIENGANVNQRNQDSCGATSLHMAVMQGDLELVKMLVQHGADVSLEIGDSTTETAASLATELGHNDVLAFLKSL